MVDRFLNREDAGRALARTIGPAVGADDAVVLALPRGGIPVGAEIARSIDAPLEVFVVRKLGVPGHEEFAMGALASGGIILLNELVIHQLGIASSEVQRAIAREQTELERREQLYGVGDKVLTFDDSVVILVDDGIATGSTMKVAVQAVRQQSPKKIIVAVPVAPASARYEFEAIADEFIAVMEPEIFYAVGEWYEDFSQTTDDEVRTILREFHSGSVEHS